MPKLFGRLFLMAFLAGLLGAKPAVPLSGKIVGITDGDTITVQIEPGDAITKVRLEGIDAPEQGQAFGAVARKWLRKQAIGKPCLVESQGKDDYGRMLAVVMVDGKSINLALVQRGLAWHYARYNQEKRLAEAEKKARKKKLGLWVDASPVAPWAWRKMSARERAAAESGRTDPAPPASSELTHWLNTRGGVRHNSSCRWFEATKRGHRCTADDGRACGICGG